MKTLTFLLLSGIIAIGCASSEKNSNDKKNYKNLIELKPPGQQNQEKSKVYIDSVELIDHDSRQALLVSGNFPDGCTHLGEASHSIHNGKIEVSLSAWRDPDMMCAQVLTPFSFIYDELPKENIKKQSSIIVNGTTYELK